ncbi:hypothetical protein AX16_005217 [Volvariella volvacea WC 439]|nr:hypothetical protein AX16_005217 [Volvariella volvacea WC 439]
MASQEIANQLIESLDSETDVISWINDALDTKASEDGTPTTLTELDQHITQLLSTLDIACEDTALELERVIEDVSRGLPRLTYDLHFMRDSALNLQSSLAQVHQKSVSVVPEPTAATLRQLETLDLIKNHMGSAREVLRDAESWSTLEIEFTQLLAEHNFAKAAERLAEASKSMVVFQHTPDYDPRRALMVSLQNQLEASLSSALVSAITAQDVSLCRQYFTIFSNIQREVEFRNYYNASRRGSLVSSWQDTHLVDCDAPSPEASKLTLVEFLPRFYADFLALLDSERVAIPAIFPNPTHTLSAFIVSVLSSLQPSFSQRLSGIHSHHGDTALKPLIQLFQETEIFAAGVSKVLEKMQYSSTPAHASTGEERQTGETPRPTHIKRRSSRMSISWRSGWQKPPTGGSMGLAQQEDLEWEHELFQPFLDFQTDYESLERRILDAGARALVVNDVGKTDPARLLKERAVDIFVIAEESMSRCQAFTYGYGSVGLVKALDKFLQSFIRGWIDIIQPGSSFAPTSRSTASDGELVDMDYTVQDWSRFQTTVHVLASARVVFERLVIFEGKLWQNLVSTAARFKKYQSHPSIHPVASTKGLTSVLEQSTLNSAELQALLSSTEVPAPKEPFSSPTPTASFRFNQISPTGMANPVLQSARSEVFALAKSCQTSLQQTVLAPLVKHLANYPSSPLWTTPGDPKQRRTVSANDLQVPTFSISPSDTIQRVAEGLLNLPRLFEVYANDDALSFSLHSLPYIDPELLQSLPEEPIAGLSETHLTSARRASDAALHRPAQLDPELVSSAWLSSLGHSLLQRFLKTVLPSIQTLTPSGAAQLSSDLEYLTNIVHALNVDSEDMAKWKQYADLEDDAGRNLVAGKSDSSHILREIARMRNWSR